MRSHSAQALDATGSVHDLRDAQTVLIVDEHDFATRNELAVDAQIDWFFDLLVERDHAARDELQHVFEAHLRAPHFDRDGDLDVEQEIEVAIAFALHALPQLPKGHGLHRGRGEIGARLGEILVLEEPIWTKVIPTKFTITDVQMVFETILERKYDKGNFRKKAAQMKFLKKLDETEIGVRHRPSLLHSFDARQFKRFRESGLVMEF